ncbi:MAG: hypothetical protein WDW38_009976 [Sanguina aurantia]
MAAAGTGLLATEVNKLPNMASCSKAAPVANAPAAPVSLAEFARSRINTCLAHLTSLPEDKLWQGASKALQAQITSDDAKVLQYTNDLQVCTPVWLLQCMLESDPQASAQLEMFAEEHRQRVANVQAMKDKGKQEVRAEIVILRSKLEELTQK